MHALLSLLLVSVSVGLSNFAGAIGIGLSGIDVRTRIRVGLAFGFFEAFMPVIGLLLGHSVAGFFGQYGKFAGGAILVLTGAYTIAAERLFAGRDNHATRGMSIQSLLVTALALSIDNLAVGFAIAIYNVPIVEAAVVMAIVSVAMSLVGLELGHRLGERVEEWSEEIGGAVLILVGVALGAGLLG